MTTLTTTYAICCHINMKDSYKINYLCPLYCNVIISGERRSIKIDPWTLSDENGFCMGCVSFLSPDINIVNGISLDLIIGSEIIGFITPFLTKKENIKPVFDRVEEDKYCPKCAFPVGEDINYVPFYFPGEKCPNCGFLEEKT